MNAKPQNNHAARTGDILETYLALSRICFASSERLSELTLETARNSVEDCVTAARGNPLGPQAWQFVFGQPAIERARSYSRGTYEILVGAQSEVAQVLISRLAMPSMQFPFSGDWMSRFSQGIRELAASTAANVAAAANIASEEAAKSEQAVRKVA